SATVIAPGPMLPDAPPVAAVVSAPTASFAPPTADTSAPAPLAVPAAAPVAVPAANGPLPEGLDERLRRLDNVLGQLADAPTAPQVTARPPAPVATPVSSSIQDAGRRWIPRFVRTMFLASADSPITGQPEPRSPWLLLDILTELQSMFHMFGDPRY